MTLNRSNLRSRANEHRDDQDQDNESEDHQAQVRSLELGATPSDRRRRPGVDRCPAAVADTAGIRYRCGRAVRIVGPVTNAHTRLLSGSSYCLRPRRSTARPRLRRRLGAHRSALVVDQNTGEGRRRLMG